MLIFQTVLGLESEARTRYCMMGLFNPTVKVIIPNGSITEVQRAEYLDLYCGIGLDEPAAPPVVAAAVAKIPYEPVPSSAGANAAREYWAGFRADEDAMLMATIKEFLRNL